ncbi:MAG TPA: hypothetical protein VN380_24285 [Thermoanaerobaculia bacterium]|jgi:hypothetical protein|nr:hypothetical protein [Thermoanaerobaculia bacterium]
MALRATKTKRIVSLVPEEVLEKEGRVIEVRLHLAAGDDPAPDRLTDDGGARMQHPGNAVPITLRPPLLLRHGGGNAGAFSWTNTRRT